MITIGTPQHTAITNSKFPLPAKPSLSPNEIDRAINFACVCRRKSLQKDLSPLKTQNGPVPVSQLENGSNI